MKTVWTPAAEAKLRSMAFGVATVEQIAVEFGITQNAVSTKLAKLKLRSTGKASEAEMTAIEMQLQLGTSPARIPVRTGIPRPVVEKYLAHRAALIKEPRKHAGKGGRS